MILTIIGGSLFVVAMLLLIAAQNRLDAARELDERAAWAYRQAERITAPVMAEAALYPTVPVEDGDDDDAPAELGDTEQVVEPTRSPAYRGRHGLGWWRELLQRYDAEDGFDISPVDEPSGPAAELVEEAPVSGPPLVVAGVVAAEGCETEAEFRARVDRELDDLFSQIIPVGAVR